MIMDVLTGIQTTLCNVDASEGIMDMLFGSKAVVRLRNSCRVAIFGRIKNNDTEG